MHVASTTMCHNDATMTKRWAPFSPPDEFDVVDAALPVSWVLATIWARGWAPGGRVEGVVVTLLIVELRSLGFLGKHDGCAVGRDNSTKKYGTPPNKVCLQTKGLSTGSFFSYPRPHTYVPLLGDFRYSTKVVFPRIKS